MSRIVSLDDSPSCESCVSFVLAKLHPESPAPTRLCKHPRMLGAAVQGRAVVCTRSLGWSCGPRARLWEKRR